MAEASGAPWEVLREANTVDVVPIADVIEHIIGGEDCPCGPSTEAVWRPDGSCGWLVVHHSLDGRERFEARAVDDA